mmetsp:Transcript_35074/g.73994  ORF Transcript_35074/g.73994 Transcript_35074/m.73994 type:complete len:1706 (-) Transcript_35074:109-5226(-)
MTATVEGSANSKLARFRQLMDAKRLHEEATTPSSLFETTPLPRSATAAVPRQTSSSQKSSAGAKSWPIEAPRTNNDEVRGVSLDLNDELEREHQHDTTKVTAGRKGGGGKVGYKENLCPNNFSAMKQIMKRKQMANAARKELDSSAGAAAAAAHDEKESDETIPVDDDGVATSTVENNKAAMNNSQSTEEKDTSIWAMMGNHLNESTMDQEQSSELAITPARWMQQNDVPSRWSSNGSNHSGNGGDGASGVLSFLGESPLFDQSVTEENEAERNLSRSAEKVKNLEERLLRSADGDLSPVKPQKEGGDDSVGDENGSVERKEVTFAIQDGWETPSAPSKHANYRKSPYMPKLPMMTSSSKLSESMEPQANPMNESAIVSDDEASGESNAAPASPSPMKSIGGDEDILDITETSEEQRWDEEFGTGLSPDDDADVTSEVYNDEFDTSERNDMNDLELVGMGSPKSRGSSGKQRHRASKKMNITPTRASLMERNQTLVKEVRFADQTCVELSERKKYYKNQAGQFKKNLSAANKENSLLRVNYELSLQENSKLKILVESLQAQKHQADLQVEAYRTQIADSDKTHRSSLKKIESTYNSHLKNSEEQIKSLHERLRRSHDANTKLQSKMDEVHGKWESRLQSDASSQELITSLKERVTASDTAASSKDASVKAMQARIDDLQNMHDQHANEIQRERNEREMIEHDRDDLQAQCNSLHKQLTEWVQTSDTLGDVFFNEDGSRNEDFVEELKEYTPVKKLYLDSSRSSGGSGSRSSKNSAQTPTSNLLARTLRSELKRRQTVAEKLESTEHKLTKLKDKLSDMKMDVEEAKADSAMLEEDLEEKCVQIAELEVALGEKDDRIARLNEELDVLIQVENGDASAAGTGSRSSRSADSVQSGSSGERDTASMLEDRLDAVEETLEYTDGELVETRARLADTQELLDQTAGELERSEEELADVRDQVQDYEVQVNNLSRDLAEKEVECANITKFSDFQTTTLETLKEKLSRSDTVNAELRTQLNSCFQSLVDLERILRTYEDLDGHVGKKMAEQSRKIARLLRTMEQFVQDRSASPARDLESRAIAPTAHEEKNIAGSGSEESSSTSLRSTRSAHYQEELNGLREEIDAAEMERDDANKQLQKAHDFLQELRDELSKQEDEHLEETTSLKRQCEELEARLSAVALELPTGEMESQNLSKTEENEVYQQLSVIRSNNAELIQENEKLRVDIQSFELQLENEKALLRATREEANGYRQDVSLGKAAFECLTTEASLTKIQLEKEGKGLREMVAQKEKELKGYQEDLSKAQTSFQEHTESMKSHCIDLERKISDEEKSRVSAEASLDDASKRVAMLEDAIKAKEEECQEKENECQELIISLKRVQNALGEAEMERGEATNTIESLENQMQEEKSVLFAYEEAIIGYKDDIRRLNNELQTTVLEKNNRIQMLEQGLTSRQTLFTEQLDRTKEERDASTAELTDMIERLQNELQSSNKTHQESGERNNLAIKDLEEEILRKNEAIKDLEEEIIRKEESLEENTQKLQQAQNEIAQVMDRLNSSEMDCERMVTKHQDEAEELVEELNRLEGQKNQVEKQIQLLRSNMEEYEEIREKERHELDRLSAQNASLQKKCNIFKDKIKSLNEKNKAWEVSYKAQSDDLVFHGMEISRLNGQVSDLKARLIRQGSGRYLVNRNELARSAQSTPQGGAHYLGNPNTM